MHSPLLQSLIWRGHRVNYAGMTKKCTWCRWNSNCVQSTYAHDVRPLHGLPVLIKGNIGTRDRMQTNGESFNACKYANTDHII